jgi:hypothetical protein
MKDSEKRLEKNLLEIIKIKEQKDKQLLSLEIFIGILVSIILFACVFVASFANIKDIYRLLLIVVGFIPFIIGIAYCLRIEQTAGYYECEKCHHKYIPTFKSVLWAMHVNRTRYLKCPKCEKKSWNKKVLSGGN